MKEDPKDMLTLSTLVDNFVRRSVIMEVKRIGSKVLEILTGIIEEKFSKHLSSACKIKVNGMIYEIFLDEVRNVEIA